MKLLFISFCYPWPLHSGGQQRRYHLLWHLAGRHDVTLLALTPSDGGAGPLGSFCERIIEVDADAATAATRRRFGPWAPPAQRFRSLLSSPLPALARAWKSDRLTAAFRAVRRSARFDAVWVDRSYFAEVARAAGFERLVVDVDDVESVSLGRELRHAGWYRSKPLHYLEFLKLRAYERSLPRRFWRLVVCKEDDRRFFAASRSVHVVPNGVEAPPAAGPGEGGDIAFIGALDYRPNIDAAEYFHRAIFPQVRHLSPAARFRIVGRTPVPEVLALHDGSATFVHATVPDLTPHYEQAAVVAAPIRLGSGTRLKVLEALARGKAVVATSTALEGLGLTPGVHLATADDPAGFASACVRLLGDAAERRRLGSAGREFVLARYRWDAIGRQAERVLTAEGGPS